MLLKAETVGLAVSVELPLIVCDIQRAGPSTGMPTKTEQADLLQAMFGRNGESPVPVIAAASPADCFNAAIEAARIAVSTGRRGSCSPTATWPTAPSRGASRTPPACPT